MSSATRKVFSVLIQSLLLSTFVSSFIACNRKTSASQESGDTSKPKIGLDVNDVSILLPFPKSLPDADRMLKIGFLSDSGKSPMTSGLFQSILARHDTKQEIEGKMMPLKSGSKFKGEERISDIPMSIEGELVSPRPPPQKTAFGPYDRMDDWKIVAMRFDPCAPPPERHAIAGPNEEVRSSDPAHCLPQLRLTAQPIIKIKGKNNSDVISAEDYSMHLLFNLNQDLARQLYAELLAFKAECGDVTSSLPLMVHPCLALEYEKKGYHGPQLERVEKIIKRFAQNLSALAMMATRDGDDPWTFMNGIVKDGAFVHLPISALHKDDPATLQRGQNGNLLEPFLNGYFQQIEFLSVGGNPSAKNDRISPIPVASKVRDFILDEYNGWTVPPAEARLKIDSLENPFENDFLSTDCASCHAAAGLHYSLARKLASKYLLWEYGDLVKKAEYTYGVSGLSDKPFPKIESKIADLWLPATTTKSFAIRGPYIQMVEPFARVRQTVTRSSDQPLVFMHFAYRFTSPSISQRAVNESALAAQRANKDFGGGSEPPSICPRQALEQCLADPIQIKSTRYETLSYCLAVHCPSRAEQLAPMFGETGVRKYRAKKPALVKSAFRAISPEFQLSLAPGDLIYGRWQKSETDQVDEIVVYPTGEMKDPTGKKFFGGPFMKLRFTNSPGDQWQDTFELVK